MARARTYSKEADVKKYVRQLLTKHGWFWWMPAANGFGRSGVSDFIALKQGVPLAIETKFGKYQPTPLQQIFLKRFAAQKGMAFIVDEANVDALEAYLVGFDAVVHARDSGRPPDASVEVSLLAALTRLTSRIV